MIVELADVAYVRRLSPFCRRMLRHLMDAGAWVERDELVDAMYGHDPEGGPLYARNNLSVHMHYLRKALQPGFYVATSYSLGYRLEVTESALIKAMLGQVSYRLAA